MDTTTQDTQEQQGLQIIREKNQLIKNTVIGQNSEQLGEILMDTIKNVQNDPAYIPQAAAIKDQVSEFINLAKVEVSMFQAVNNLRR